MFSTTKRGRGRPKKNPNEPKVSNNQNKTSNSNKSYASIVSLIKQAPPEKVNVSGIPIKRQAKINFTSSKNSDVND